LQQQQQRLLADMRQQYFWAREMPQGDPTAGTPDAYFQSLLYRPTDRFSYSQPTAAFDGVFTTGHRIG
jgi:hypothetical protein